MVKTSYEETYPWNDSNRWAVTLSVDTMKWVIKAWDEGLVEAESDLESLKSENLTLKGIKETLEDDNSKGPVFHILVSELTTKGLKQSVYSPLGRETLKYFGSILYTCNICH